MASDRLWQWFVSNNECRQFMLKVLQLGLAIAGIMAEIAVQAAIRHSVGARHFGFHAGVHIVVTMLCSGRAMGTVVIILRLVRHGAGRQREIQPDSRKQPKGATAPGPAFTADADRMTQVLVSIRVLALSPKSHSEAID
jgi:hypothetical protein